MKKEKNRRKVELKENFPHSFEGWTALEELRKKFIVEERIEEKRMAEHIERSLKFGKVSRDGSVIIEKRGLAEKDKVGLVLVMRYLANYLEKEIPSEVTVKEVSKFLSIPEKEANARLADLTKEKIAVRVKRGIYKINLGRIEDFLTYLENKYLKEQG